MVLGHISRIYTTCCVAVFVAVVVVVTAGIVVVVTHTLSIVWIANATTNNVNNLDYIFKIKNLAKLIK